MNKRYKSRSAWSLLTLTRSLERYYIFSSTVTGARKRDDETFDMSPSDRLYAPVFSPTHEVCNTSYLKI